jgi:hypothetical protein
MNMQLCKAATFGDLVAEFFDEAARYSHDPMEVSRLAILALRKRLGRTLKSNSPSSPNTCTSAPLQAPSA